MTTFFALVRRGGSANRSFVLVRKQSVLGVVGVAICAAGGATSAFAQNFSLDYFTPQTLASPVVPSGFDRGGNTAIENKPRPDYDPIGLQIGGFQVFPVATTYVGGSSNVLLSSSNPKPDALVGGELRFLALEDNGSTNVRIFVQDWENDYVSTPYRTQNQFNLDGVVGQRVTDGLKIDVEAGLFRYGDNNSIGTLNNLESILQLTTRNLLAARAQFISGQFSQIFGVDRNQFLLSPINYPDLGVVQTYYDDHTSLRYTSQSEYALSPSAYLFGELTYTTTTYTTSIPAVSGVSGVLPNYGSNSYRGEVGLNLDISNLLRGQVSIGYNQRNYDSATYSSDKGFVFAGRMEYFMNPLTQFTLNVLNEFDDGTLFSANPVKFLLVSLKGDRELRENMIASLSFRYIDVKPVGSAFTLISYGSAATFKWMLNRQWSVNVEVGGEKSINPQSIYSPPNTEFRAKIGFSWSI
jgi:hypothetical protein